MCGDCNKKKCVCKREIKTCYEAGCDEYIDTKCVIYKPLGGQTKLDCFTKVPARSDLENILETWDKKLCDLTSLIVPYCAQTLLDVPVKSDINTLVLKLLHFICDASNSDQFVKVSATDTTSGYLNDKVDVGTCLIKTILPGPGGSEKLVISLDFACLAQNLPSCVNITLP